MTDLSNTQEQSILNDIAAGGVYVSLHTADEGDEPVPNRGTGSTEVTAADYSRQFVAEADLTVDAPDAGPSTLSNNLEINWGTTQNDWGTVTHGALWNTAIGGTGEAPYTATVALGNGGSAPAGITVKINAGEMTFSLD